MNATTHSFWALLIRAVVRITTPPDFRDALEQELTGEFVGVSDRRGRFAGVSYLVRQLAGVVRYGLRDKMLRFPPSNRGERRSAGAVSTGREVLGHVLRRLGRRPANTGAVVVLLALGIGVNAVMLHVVDTLLLSPPPHVGQAEQLRNVLVLRRGELAGTRSLTAAMSYPAVRDLERVSGIESVAAFVSAKPVLGRGQEARSIDARRVTGTYFEVLNVPMRLGRPLLVEDDQEDAPLTAVISSNLWQELFGGNSSALGSSIELNAQTYEIVGVAPAGFAGSDQRRVDVWIPLLAGSNSSFWKDNRLFHHLRAIVRLEQTSAAQRVTAIATDIHRSAHEDLVASDRYDPDARIQLERLAPAAASLASREERLAPWLLGVSGLVLLLACAGAAHLLLIQAMLRRTELGVRLALGISRRRLAAESVLEGVLPAGLAVAIALPIGLGGGPLLGRLLVPEIAWETGTANVRYFMVLGLAGLLTGIAAAVVPAMRSLRLHPGRVLGGLPALGRGTPGIAMLHVSQVALTALLLICATLFLRSLDEVRRTDLGYAVDEVLIARPVLEGVAVSDRLDFYDSAANELSRLPGVRSVGFAAMSVPFGGQVFLGITEGAASVHEEERNAFVTLASPDYFDAFGMRITRGRALEPLDRDGSQPVAVINETMAHRLWPEIDPIGGCFGLERANADCITVVGVASDGHRGSLEEAGAMQVFLPIAQNIIDWAPDVLVVRTRGPADTYASATRGALLSAFGNRLRHVEVQSVRQLVNPFARSWEVASIVFSLFGILALVIAAFGLYSLLAHEVAARAPELALRAALGADRAVLLRAVLARGVGLTTAGLVLGFGAALVLVPVIAPLLYRTDARAITNFAAVTVVLGATAAIASLLPSIAAGRVEPASVLRR